MVSLFNPQVSDFLNPLISSIASTDTFISFKGTTTKRKLEKFQPNMFPMGGVDTIWKAAGFLKFLMTCFFNVRSESVNLWNALNEQEQLSLKDPTLLFIERSPGIGKSTELLGWFLWSTSNSKRNCCWIHGNADGTIFYVVDYSSKAWLSYNVSNILDISFETTNYRLDGMKYPHVGMKHLPVSISLV